LNSSNSNFKEKQAALPILETLRTAAARTRAAFHTPGHKQGQGASAALLELFGAPLLRADLPELPELDNLFTPVGVIQQAQALAASAFGAQQTWFLVNGSTCGIEAAVLATCNPGDKIVLSRNVHQSAIAALILSGAVPIFVEPEYDRAWDIAHCVAPDRIEAALARHPDAKAVLLVSPTYSGVCGDLAAIAQLTQRHNIPLIVDEAHGPHFAFHPDLPSAALTVGADLVVQSTHKVLSALTQAAMLHVQGTQVNRDRLSRSLQLVQSTSPSYLLLASLDAARQQMATQGEAMLSQTLHLADRARTEIAQIPGLSVLQPPLGNSPGFFALDRTRLTVDVTELGLTGFEADEILHQDLGVTAELPSLRQLTFIFTIGNTSEETDRLIQAFKTLSVRRSIHHRSKQAPDLKFTSSQQPIAQFQCSSSAPLTPRQAFFAPSLMVPVEQAIAQISAELICPYPPGIPILIPGEIITPEAVGFLQQVMAAGGVVTGCTDPDFQTLKIVGAVDLQG
jgi:arginine decarboxylase